MASSRQTRGGNFWDKSWSKLAVAESIRIMLDLGRSLSRNAGTLRVKVAIARAFSGRCRAHPCTIRGCGYHIGTARRDPQGHS